MEVHSVPIQKARVSVKKSGKAPKKPLKRRVKIEFTESVERGRRKKVAKSPEVVEIPQITHFIGIGGIGVSYLARYYLETGTSVSGSDLVESEITRALEKIGATIAIGPHKGTNIPKETTRVIYTAAIQKTNPEFTEAKKRKLKLMLHAEAVGELTRKYRTVTISGSHGKSTTTALSAFVLEDGHCDPTVFVGTKLREYGNANYRKGCGAYLVLEADEYNRSFLNYESHIAIITNIDAEHLDTYKDIEDIEKTFTKFLKQVPSDGWIIANADDERTHRVAKPFGKKVRWYSVKDPDAKLIEKHLKIPGQHNLSNALAAVRLGEVVGIRGTEILHALSRFHGSWRRFELKGIVNGAFVFDDYAHHPSEIKATLAGARKKFPWRRIWCVFQPHHYERLKALWDDFVTAFDEADIVGILPVYEVAGREQKRKIKGIDSRTLAQKVADRGKQTFYLDSLQDAHDYIKKTARKGDVIILMGAGDIYTLKFEYLN